MRPRHTLVVLALAAAAWGCRAKTVPPPGGGDEEPAPACEVENLPEIKMSKEAVMSSDYEITDEQKRWLMKIAKESSCHAARDENYEPEEPPPSWSVITDKGAAFVTLRLKREGHPLRGCIGHIIARIPLYKCVAEMARSATIHDTRFSPVTESELEDIHYEISVLTPLVDVEDPAEIEVGTDGVVLSLGYHHGVFLPQVPVEQGWDRVEYLDNLCYKAGLMRKGCWKDPEAKLEKFQAIVWEEAD